MQGAGGWLLVTGLVAVLVIAIATLRAVWPSFGDSDAGTLPDRAIESLRERHARGEIDETEFERRRAYLRDAAARPASEELPCRDQGDGRNP